MKTYVIVDDNREGIPGYSVDLHNLTDPIQSTTHLAYEVSQNNKAETIAVVLGWQARGLEANTNCIYWGIFTPDNSGLA